ncbi:hypothetical protein [Salinibacter sp.]|uniref:hypothetical protein n=1 Tax=Salinibacter sp. TaxID=2065818 RepID=UPI0021E6E799|nr:hypothetical protein [Salinibacter sp.]
MAITFDSKTRFLYVLPVLGAVVMAIGLFVAWPFTVDDAFISFRYAKNFAEGHGLVWNPGLDPVEGYTNFSWVVLCALYETVLGTSEVPAKVSGVVSLVGVLALVGRSVYRQTESPSLSACATGGLLLFPPTYYHAVSGLETMFFALLLVAVFEVGRRIREGTRSRLLLGLVPALGVLLGLTRPEGLVPGAVVFGFVISQASPESRRRLLTYTAVAAIPAVLYMAWRTSHFGHLLPNTFYAKTGDDVASIVVSSAKWFIEKWPPFVALLSIVTVNALYVGDGRKKNYVYEVCFLTSVLVTYLLLTPGMDYLARFSFHIIPVTSVILVSSFGPLAEASRKAYLYPVVLSHVIVFIGLISLEMITMRSMYGLGLDNAHVRLGKTLKTVDIPDDKRTLATMDAGAVPYYSEWTSYDLLELNSEFLARGGTPPQLVEKEKPTVLILNSAATGAPRGYTKSWREGYEKVCSFYYMRNIHHLDVYIREGADEEYESRIRSEIVGPARKSQLAEKWFYGPKAVVDFALWRFQSLLALPESPPTQQDVYLPTVPASES